MSDFDPPRLKRLITTLSLLGNPTIADEHARKIHSAMLDVLVSYRSHGHEIGRDDAGFYARPRRSTGGPARELRDIRGKAHKVLAGKCDLNAWITAWAALPDRTKRRLCPRQALDRGTLAGGFSAPGYQMIAPKPEIVVAAIEAESMRKTPGTKRRRANSEEKIAIQAIKSAYRELTGRKSARVFRDGRIGGRFVNFGREIDFIFGTKLFAVKDSRRLR